MPSHQRGRNKAMPILYESVFEPKIIQLKRKYTPKTLKIARSLQEAHRWRVIEEYAVSSIYLTPEQLRDEIKKGLEKGCTEKDAILENFKVLQTWAIWKGLYTEYHIRYEAIIKGSPIPQAVIILILAICLTTIIIFGIWLVKQELIEPIIGAIPEEILPVVATTIAIGVGVVLIGGGIYLATRWMKKRKGG
jgi:hypothetical protein